MLLHPKTYVWGNFLILIVILFIIVQHIHDQDMKGILIELPFFLLSLAIVFLPHPLSEIVK